MEPLEKFLVADACYSLAFLLFFFVLFCRKIMKMDKMGENQSTPIPRAVWAKFFLIVLVMVFYTVHMLLAYTMSKYWLSSYPNFSLLALFYLVMFTLQLYIVVTEVRKCRYRSKSNVVFWSVCFITEIMEIVGVEVAVYLCQMLLPKPSPTTVLQVLMCLCYISLILITVLVQRKVGDLHRQIVSTFKSIKPSCESKVVQDPQRTVHNLQVIQRQKQLICLIKIAVYVDQNATIITKTDRDFQLLNQEMVKTFAHCPVLNQPILRGPVQNLMKYGQQRQRCYEHYLIELVRTEEYFTNYLLQFLQIPADVSAKLLRNQRISGMSKVRKISGLYEEHEQLKAQTKIPFFRVSSYKNSILISNPEILELNITKSPNEILEFHNSLIEQKKLNVELLTDPPEPDALIHFIDLVVNKKSLWKSFAVWLGLGIQLQNKIYRYFDVWNVGFQGIAMQVIGHQVVFDRDGKMHTMYLLSLTKKTSDNEHNTLSKFVKSEGTVLTKRYTDFFNLDKHVRHFIQKNQINCNTLPSLPPKFSPFGRKTSPASRQARFDSYIKQVMSIEGINRCVKFLEFIEVDSVERSHIFESSPKPNNELMEGSQKTYFGDLEQN